MLARSCRDFCKPILMLAILPEFCTLCAWGSTSTASIMTLCCSSQWATCIRRDDPTPLCGMSPSPPISLDVSTITTRFCISSASRRASSLMAVVLPTPAGKELLEVKPHSTGFLLYVFTNWWLRHVGRHLVLYCGTRGRRQQSLPWKYTSI